MSEKLIIIEDILFKSFIIAFIMLMVSFVCYLVFNQQIIDIWIGLYGLSAKNVSIMILGFYGIFKMLIFILFFIPAIAVHWTRKSLAKKEQ